MRDSDDISLNIQHLDFTKSKELVVYLPEEYLREEGFMRQLQQNLRALKESAGVDLNFWILPSDIKIDVLDINHGDELLFKIPEKYYSPEKLRLIQSLLEQAQQNSDVNFKTWIIPDYLDISKVDETVDRQILIDFEEDDDTQGYLKFD